MDCNRDEAVRAKGIAENKIIERDITGAKNFALKAQSLFPELDGLSQLLQVIELYVTSEERINGEIDYYRILGVDPLSEEDELKRQYRKMALAIHPDKNKSVGAEGAFKILSQIWSVLSRKEMRLAYDLRMNLRTSNQRDNIFRNIGASACSSNSMYAASAANPLHIPTPPRTPITTINQPFSAPLHHERNQTPYTGSQHNPTVLHPRNVFRGTDFHIPSHQNTPTAAWSQYSPDLSHQRSPPTATSTQNITSCHGTPATATGSQYDPASFQTENPTVRSCSWQVPYHQNTTEQPYLRHPIIFSNFQFARASNPQLSSDHHRAPQTSTPPDYIPAPPDYIPAPRPKTFHKCTPVGNHLPASYPRTVERETFWTACSRCRIHYEYQKTFLNQNLLCRQCRKPFLATAMPHPTNASRTAASSVTRNTLSGTHLQSSVGSVRRRQGKELNAASDDEVLHKNSTASENFEAATTTNGGSIGLNVEKLFKRKHMDGQNGNSTIDGRQVGGWSKPGHKRTSANLKKTSVAEQAVPSGYVKPRSEKQFLQIGHREMLAARAKMEILSKVNDWKVTKSNSASEKKSKMKNAMNPLENNLIRDESAARTTDSLFINPNHESQSHRSSILHEPNDVCANSVQSVSMSVPDADFHDFDESRTEKFFSGNQIWAAYGDDDGMPRYYALVHNVISIKPFKMQISWLNSKTTSEFGSLDWIGSGFTKVSGNFRVGKYVISTSLNSFSHPVKWKKGTRGVIQIFPAKGDVWALYTNWSHDWDELTPAETIHKYDLVVVLEDYNEHKGVLVAPLIKVAGFRSVFRQHLDSREIFTIPRELIFRFSHQVPSHILNGQEAEKAPRGCYELDPAALTLELLNVLPDVSEAVAGSIVEHEGQLRGSALNGGSVEETKPILTYSRKNKRKKMAGDADESGVRIALTPRE